MAFHLLLIFALINLAFAGSNATLTKEERHWISVFPHTSMPKALKDILPRPGRGNLFRGDVAPNKKGVNDPEFGAYSYGDYDNSNGKNSKKGYKSEDDPTNKGVNDPEFGAYSYGDYDNSNGKNSKKEYKTEDDPTNKGVNDPEFGAYSYGDYDNSNGKNSKEESKTEDAATNKGVNDPQSGAYGYGDNSGKESKDEVTPTNKDANDPKLGNRKSLELKSNYDNDAIKETVYFLEEGLLPGTKVNLPRLVQKPDSAIFLPQQVAESMPMSNDKLPEILKNFSLKAESRAASGVKITVKNCERAEMKGEEKYCATSLESFVDLGVSTLGKNIRLLSHEIGKETKNPLFTIDRGVRKIGENDMICHKMTYPYAVYLCHSIEQTEVYKVPLLGFDGTKVKALAVCHKDTSAWSPHHIVFQILKDVKPGTVPICHFLGRDTLVWIPN